jgi:DNA transposition AAA+ family ATPase
MGRKPSYSDKAEKTRAALALALESGDITQTEVARRIGKSTSTVSGFVSGNYAGRVEEIGDLVADLLAVFQQRAERGNGGGEFVETAIARKVLGLLNRCRTDCEFGLVTGEAGLGKTRAIAEFSAKHPTTIVLRARTTTKNIIAFCRALGKAIGVTVPGNPATALEEIIEALRGTGRLVIIDEAQRLGETALEAIRDIHDEAECGIVLVGNRHVQELVYGTGTARFSQHFSRLGAHLALTPDMLEPADIAALIDDDLAAPDLRFLLKLATGRGGLRTMLKTYTLAVRLAEHEPAADFGELLREAHGLRNVGGARH